MDNLTAIKTSWPAILDRIKVENDLTAVSFSTWILPIEIHSADTEGITFIVPTDNHINILNKNLLIIYYKMHAI